MTVASTRLRFLAMNRWEMASESHADELAVEGQLLFSYEHVLSLADAPGQEWALIGPQTQAAFMSASKGPCAPLEPPHSGVGLDNKPDIALDITVAGEAGATKSE